MDDIPCKYNVLGLDLSMTETGWVMLYRDGTVDYGTKSFPPPKKGRKSIPDEHPGKQFLAFSRWLGTLLRETTPDLIAYERPAGQFKSMDALLGLRGIFYSTAAGREIPVDFTYPSSLKKWATGNGKADKSMMYNELCDRGYDIDNDNIVDAFFLALWGRSRLDQS